MNVFDNVATFVSIIYVCFWECVIVFLQHLAMLCSQHFLMGNPCFIRIWELKILMCVIIQIGLNAISKEGGCIFTDS